MIRPVALDSAHMECRSLAQTLPVLTDLLAFERRGAGEGWVTLRHPNSAWDLIVHEGGPDAPDKQMHNHFGVRVADKAEVDAAYAHLSAHCEEYGVRDLSAPSFSHGSYSVYFLEPGTNGMEIECYQDVLRKESGGQRLGGVRSHHWDVPMPESRFPGRGYIPQAFTHGTLACGDIKTSSTFYAEVLGLEAHRAYERITYVKHPDTRHYIVCGQREQWNHYGPSFRFTITVDGSTAVEDNHRWLQGEAQALGVTELGPITEQGGTVSFMLADPDGNWWEIQGS